MKYKLARIYLDMILKMVKVHQSDCRIDYIVNGRCYMEYFSKTGELLYDNFKLYLPLHLKLNCTEVETNKIMINWIHDHYKFRPLKATRAL